MFRGTFCNYILFFFVHAVGGGSKYQNTCIGHLVYRSPSYFIMDIIMSLKKRNSKRRKERNM